MATATPSPIDYPHMMDLPDTTLGDLAGQYQQDVTTLAIEKGSDLKISPDRTSIVVKDTETPMNEFALEALATWVDFPKPFLNRLEPDLQRDWLNELLRRDFQPGNVRIGNRTGILSILKPKQVAITPGNIIDVAIEVLGKNAAAVSSDMTRTEFYLDTVLPIRGKQNLGDPQVGDIVKAGLRFDLSIGQSLAPTVNPFSYRLWCTNGCSTLHEGTKIDARGQTVDEVLEELEAKARIAFALVESDVAAMFDLRNTKVDSPERTINRLARERRFPERLRVRMIEAVPAMTPPDGQFTMFDLVQLATNLANDPAISNRGTRVRLQELAGSIITDHSERCTVCASRLN